MLLYLSNNKDTIFINREIYIMNNFNVKALIKIDIIKLENIVLNLQRNVIIVNFC